MVVLKSLKTTSDPILHLLINMARTPHEGQQAIRRLGTVIRSFWNSPLENTHSIRLSETPCGLAHR